MAEDVGESLKLNIKITSTGEDKLSKITKNIKTLNSILGKTSSAIREFNKSIKSITAVNAKPIGEITNGMGKATSAARSAAKALSGTKAEIQKTATATKETAGAVESFEEKFKKLDESSADDLAKSFKETAETAKTAAESVSQVVATTKKIKPIANIDPTKEALNTAFSAMAFSGINTQTEQFSRIFGEVEEKLKNVRNIQTINNLSEQLKSGAISAKQFENAIKQLGGANVDTPQFSDIKQNAEGAAQGVKRVGKEISKLGGYTSALDKIKSGFSKIKSSVSGLTKPLQKVAKTFGRILVYRAANTIIRAFTETLKTGIQNLARYSEEANATMSQLATSGLYLKNSVAAAAMPVIQQAMPMLINLTQYAVKALNAINLLISSLQGKTSFTRAKEYAVDYASSLDKSASSASKSVEKMKRDLMGFDELNVLSAPDTGTSGGAAGEDYSAMFEDVTITQELDKVVEKLKTILAIVGSVGAGLVAWKISKFLFGLDEGITKAELLKKSLSFAAGVTLTVIGITLLVKGIKDIKVEGVNAKNFWETIAGALSVTAGGATIGKSLGSATIGGAVGGILGGGSLIAGGLESAFTDGVDGYNSWLVTGGGALMGASIGILFGPKGAVAGALIGALAGLVTIAVTWISQHWGEVEAAFDDFINKLKKLPTEMWNEVKAAANDIKNGFLEAWGSDDSLWEKIKASFQAIIDGVKKFFGIASPSKVMSELGSFVTQGFFNGITESWDNLVSKVSNSLDKLKQKFSDKVKEIKNVFTSWWDNLKSWWNSLSLGNLHIKMPHFEWTTQPAQGWIAKVLSAINLPTSLPKLNVKWYASGGFPEDGLFMANHSELVGKFSNGKTAVANNMQIQAGIEEAAYRGFIRAISQTGNMGGQGGTYKFVAQLNGKTLFEEVVNQNNTTVKSTGNTPLLV